MEVDLKSPEGAAQVVQLINRADVLIEGFRPGAMKRPSLGPQVFEASNPNLVDGRVTGWGHDRPQRLMDWPK